MYKWDFYVENKSSLKIRALWDFWVKNTLWCFMKSHIFSADTVMFLLWLAGMCNLPWKLDKIIWKTEKENVHLWLDSISDAVGRKWDSFNLDMGQLYEIIWRLLSNYLSESKYFCHLTILDLALSIPHSSLKKCITTKPNAQVIQIKLIFLNKGWLDATWALACLIVCLVQVSFVYHVVFSCLTYHASPRLHSALSLNLSLEAIANEFIPSMLYSYWAEIWI